MLIKFKSVLEFETFCIDLYVIFLCTKWLVNPCTFKGTVLRREWAVLFELDFSRKFDFQIESLAVVLRSRTGTRFMFERFNKIPQNNCVFLSTLRNFAKQILSKSFGKKVSLKLLWIFMTFFNWSFVYCTGTFSRLLQSETCFALKSAKKSLFFGKNRVLICQISGRISGYYGSRIPDIRVDIQLDI